MMSEPPKRFQKIERGLAGLFVGLAALFAAFVIAELISRMLIDHGTPIEYVYPPGATRTPKPYVMYGGAPDVKDLNALGYRGPAPQNPKPADEYRIVLLGGSTVFVGFPPIPERLEQLLREQGRPRARVYNFGVISSVSGTELARIVYEAADYTPDLVLIYNGGNDLLVPLTFDPRPGYPFNYVIYENNPLFERDLNEYPLLALIINGSNLGRIIFHPYLEKKLLPIERLKREVNFGSATWEAEIARCYLQNLVKAAKVSRGLGAQFAAFFQPLVYYKTPLAEAERALTGALAPPGDYFESMRRRITAGLATAAAENGLRLYDLSGIYDGRAEQIFSDAVHVSQEGYNLAAEEICKRILPLIPE